MKKSYIVLIIIAVIVMLLVILLVSSLVGGYNNMVSKSESVENSLSNLDVMLQRRADLIPNLVNTVKGYASHETLSRTLNSLNVIVENYPDLKASENFIQLSDELAGTENRISTARRDYNENVKDYNLIIKKFPNVIIANIFGFEEKTYFEASEGSQEVPSVNFD